MWTKLRGTEIWTLAERQYDSPAGRAYHNMGHVEHLYEVAEELGYPYDEDLDQAILRHDVIYDKNPQKEFRSALWMLGTVHEASAKTKSLVMSTADHTPCEDNRLIILDLYDLSIKDRREANLILIREESKSLYEISEADFKEANIAFMSGLYDRIMSGRAMMTYQEEGLFDDILYGIEEGFINKRREVSGDAPGY